MSRLSCALLLALITACDCSDAPLGACTTTVDCPEMQVCIDGSCQVRGVDTGVDPEDTGVPDTASDTPDASDASDATTCETAIFCGSPPVCCEAGTECALEACLPECESGVRCGADRMTCCGDGQVCVSEMCTDPGEMCSDSFDCGEGAFCEPTLGRCLPQFDPLECISEPVFGEFETTIEWAFEEAEERPTCNHAISSPIVIDLDGEGAPELLINLACDSDWQHGALRALAGDTGEVLWTSVAETNGRTSIAAGDMRGDGEVTIIAVLSNRGDDRGRAIAFAADGTELWRSTMEDGTTPLAISGVNGAPTLADLDGDGVSEIIFGAVVLDADGSLIWQRDRGGSEGTNSTYSGGISAIADIDGDGEVEIVTGRRAYERDGTLSWLATVADGYPAIGDFDADGLPDVALVGSGELTILDGVDGTVKFDSIALPGGGIGGPPTIADFDGDGLPEIGVAGARSYTVFDPDGGEDGEIAVLWSQPTQDASSNATGSSVFDFEGDGIAEVVYQDECYVRVYRGTDGTVLLEQASTSATIHEYPLVVDVDGDGNSEIVAVANSRATGIPAQCRTADAAWDGARQGVFVYGDVRDQWVGTRRLWNQHAYHVTNVLADGSIPAVAMNNWETPGLNNFRQNTQGEGAFNAPDLEVASLDVDLSACPSGVLLRARVRNIGSLGVDAGVPVAFYRGSLDAPGELIGTTATDVPLLPGGSTLVTLEAPIEGMGPFEFHAVVDDDGTGGEDTVPECREDNNARGIGEVDCNLLI